MKSSSRLYVTIEADAGTPVLKKQRIELERQIAKGWRVKGWKKVSVNVEPR